MLDFARTIGYFESEKDMKDRRIVITGMGALSPLGNSAEETWAGMKAGRSGITKIESIDTNVYAVHIGGGEIINTIYVIYEWNLADTIHGSVFG